ncbi:hypothetical protein LTR48_001731 [Friedmanniomyces endolithicus]|uniref:Uncharacterized protein n=1 Tax=Rachicladosporium monterosium TaxID=1507873 RepID=A0ABR0LCX4_9PEZI|nr:hypothetical protein LTR48_001731 [Friedmanniomyces endolithicus]KAK1809637.1 hypothetical protein LTR12_015994 [Friedmanniomyces endolithicus]KAK5146935.1 hypothetical protein LTR32_001544 [Rachicladosporium monterosium]
MAFTAEGSSLSAITAIASDPPQHPGIPIQGQNQPLVLYIARVPGSQDVFLTPQKPREKVVTAHDVQASLYYVHVNSEFDGEMLRPAKPASADPEVQQKAPVKRKALSVPPNLPSRPQAPVSPPYSVSDKMPGFNGGPVKSLRPARIARRPISGSADNDLPPPVPPHLDLPEIPRRSLPTPPEEYPRHTSLHNENVRLLRGAGHSHDNNPYFREYLEEPEVPAEDPSNSDYAPGSLTLIRRDPASSEQWNVASIHDPPVLEVSSSNPLGRGSARRIKRGGAPLYLDITNPAYSQFIDADRPESRTSTSTHSSDTEPVPEGTFRRRLYMPGSRYGEHSYGHDSASKNDAMRTTLRNRTSVDMSATTPPADKRNKSYTFTSPWSGRCEFATSAAGSSLKCRHTLARQGAVEVSELRFNLPNSAKNTPTPVAEKRASYFSRHARNLSSGEDCEGSATPSFLLDEDGRVDLTLGQEKAGGGFGGKQAKLGKLVIEPEGLKMLDLLVAANVGLWWRAYERG